MEKVVPIHPNIASQNCKNIEQHLQLNGTVSPQLDVFKTLNQRTNYCQFLLSHDIEKDPDPTIVDPTKTISAPDSQGNISVFGTTNAGRQCVAMSTINGTVSPQLDVSKNELMPVFAVPRY